MRSYFLASCLALAACGGGAADSPGGGGGGVSFGGAQDIGEFRGILERGEIPGPSTLDANGFFNEHFNEPPAPTCDGTLCLTPGVMIGKDWLTGGYQAALQISVNTNVDPTQFPRLPMKLVVVVDHSGSMAEDGRLDKVKGGLHTLIDNLQAEDRLAIVSFDDVVTLDAPFSSTSTLDRAQLHAIVDTLQPRGGTNIFDGLEAGFEQLGTTLESEKQNRVIFLSDGLATVGNTSRSAITEMATSYISRGVGLTTIGVGNEFDVDLMRGLAERGAGNFYFVEDATAANEVFTEELDYFMQPLALDLRIEATASTGWNFGEVIGTRLWSSNQSNGSMQVPAVFFASRTSQGGEQGRRGGGSMLFIQLLPSAHEAGDIASLTMTYRLPDSSQEVRQTLNVSYDRDPQEILEQPYLSYPQMAERYAMYNMFLGLRQATSYAESNYNCASASLGALRANAAPWSAAHEADLDLAADLQLVDMFQSNLSSKGASSETALATCPNADNPYGEPGYYGDDTYQYGCMSAGSGNASWLVLVGVGLVAVRRRRRS
ncbi:MAG TPA: VWA domain-containing protein [Kofleriaceae bacterium]|nr:VWA domain-containing protein [Kofleriaceae bacterium]